MPFAVDPTMMTERSDAILLYDGLCGYCNWFVRLIARIDTHERIRFAPLQSELGKSVIERHPNIAGEDSAILLERSASGGECVWTRWRLTRALPKHLTGFWKIVCRVLGWIPLPVGNPIYDVIARNRYRIFGKYEQCRLPDAALRRRLADFPPSSK